MCLWWETKALEAKGIGKEIGIQPSENLKSCHMWCIFPCFLCFLRFLPLTYPQNTAKHRREDATLWMPRGAHGGGAGSGSSLKASMCQCKKKQRGANARVWLDFSTLAPRPTTVSFLKTKWRPTDPWLEPLPRSTLPRQSRPRISSVRKTNRTLDAWGLGMYERPLVYPVLACNV